VLAEIPAVSLFVERARQVHPGFALTPDNAAPVAAIVAALDGVPLAIELAAARLSALSPEALLARLEHRLRVLRDERGDLPPRLRTMTDAIAWSYDLLDPAEQALLRRLAIFLGGWTIEAAEVVCPAIGDPPLDVFDGITSLVDKSLIRPLPAPTAAPRFTMLETVREFGLERLAESGELAAAREAHAAWCLTLAEEAEPHLNGSEQVIWLDRLEIEHDNMRAALGWLREQEDADHGLRLATALLRFWDTRDYPAEGRSHLHAFLALAGDSAPAAIRAKALDAASELASWEADHAAGARLAAEALAIQREREDAPGIVRALWLLGTNTLALGDVALARTYIAEGMALARSEGDRAGEALHLRITGTAHTSCGEPTLAIPNHEAALELWHALGARAEMCSEFAEMAVAVSHAGDRERAIGLWEQSLQLAREVGEAWHVAHYLEGHAELALAAGQSVLASRLLGAADAWRVRNGAPMLGTFPSSSQAFATARQNLGDRAFGAALAEGRALTLDEAVQEVQAALTVPVPLASHLPDWAVSLALTPREYEVLRLLTRRLSDREIADTLFVSPRTVHGHVASLFAKLGVTNRRDAARVAEAHGLA
jgi:non-specific serine/threonine protein kinase